MNFTENLNYILIKEKIMNSTLCIIVPCYNEEAALPYFLQEIRKVADNMSTTFQLDFEILFINDGSRDKTLQILRQAAQEDKRAKDM